MRTVPCCCDRIRIEGEYKGARFGWRSLGIVSLSPACVECYCFGLDARYPTAGRSRIDGGVSIDKDMDPRALLKLLQLASPAFPIGAYAYSQGLEGTVETGAVRTEAQAQAWITGLAQHHLQCVDLPILARIYNAARVADTHSVHAWAQWLYASRESAELRLETAQMGRACAQALCALEIDVAPAWRDLPYASTAALYALAAVQWQVALGDIAHAYAWSWAENQTACAIKLVPLGQTAGQRMLRHIADVLPQVVTAALELSDEELGFFAPGLALGSALHETQYTRLFRS